MPIETIGDLLKRLEVYSSDTLLKFGDGIRDLTVSEVKDEDRGDPESGRPATVYIHFNEPYSIDN
ncbi:MAG: hypothetical protein AAF515_05175 [Pseudomonadota bacterium]